ncbi:hypothetical protein ALP58_102443 [Pseudomonas savastanoi]|uniref:Uncharacterized protein n=3 Tax=Pseudomonas syringae group TaxID=136849 RepID=A0A3M5G2F2_PSESS|nr:MULTISPECIES: hypothetical protein [Pseudomonas syringae group]KPW90239.1 hypothetical protein ALO79_100675 [Pseudomonas syringae pv. castaneae]RMO68443.1 hypothetical protein ALQ36_103138 [Pseudomonas syringae pv. primulae]RMS80093.1 hypothetical protein ALP59_102646 [Pseudomonas savastanoi]RMS82768.1 hypothetical protein ALP58_102443 [Pseudomonas savastanoi]RMU39735.1 hypothetical protein ALP30_103580 [Pseudomonas syringae pv. primulae]
MNCNPETMRQAARKVAAESGFSAAEILAMPFNELLWWITD